MAINPERIPMNEQEEEAVNRLLAREAGEGDSVSLVRNGENETGPVRVEIDGRAWLVDETGRYRKVGA